jgi:hypothetical protein
LVEPLNYGLLARDTHGYCSYTFHHFADSGEQAFRNIGLGVGYITPDFILSASRLSRRGKLIPSTALGMLYTP